MALVKIMVGIEDKEVRISILRDTIRTLQRRERDLLATVKKLKRKLYGNHKKQPDKGVCDWIRNNNFGFLTGCSHEAFSSWKNPDLYFCQYCGRKIKVIEPVSLQKDRTTKEWKDRGKNKVHRSEIVIGRKTVEIHRIDKFDDVWFATCDGFLDCISVGVVTLAEAKRRALKLLRDLNDEMTSDLIEL